MVAMDMNDSINQPIDPTNETGAAPRASIDRRYDVVIVGARAAGASTAMLLAKRGLTVLAVDRSSYGSDTLSTHSLAGAGVLQLSRWGLLDRIRAAGTPVANTVDFRYGDDDVVIEIPARGDVDGLYSPRRTVLDKILVDAALEAGADVRHGVSMLGVCRTDDGRVDGVDLEVDGTIVRVAADYVIGADGMRSRVAKEVGAQLLHEGPVGAASMFTYYRGLRDDIIVNRYRAGAVAGFIPTNDGAAVVWAGVPADRFAAEGRGRVADLHAEITGSFPDVAEQLRGAERVGGYRAFPGAPGMLRQPWGPGWALVGDAGYFKDPVSAHGITDALIGAELVAEAVAAACLDLRDELDAFTRYQSARDEMAAKMLPAVAAAAALPTDMGVLKQAFRDMAGAMRHEMGVIADMWGAGVSA